MKRERREQILIIGLGKFGMSVAKTLSKYDCDVMAIDDSIELVDEAQEYVTHAAKVDARNIEALKEIGAGDFDIAIIGVGDNLESSIMIALLLKELKVPYIIAKSRDEMHAKLLNMIGVNKVVQPEWDIGVRIAKNLMHKNLIEQMEIGKNHSIIQIDAPSEWIGRKIIELNLRAKRSINIICIEKLSKEIISPMADYLVEAGDIITLIVPNNELTEDGYLSRIV